MYSSIQIRGYRGLDSFGLRGLGRVNLLVGANNSGKTSILECVALLRSGGTPHVLSSILGRRGEWGYVDEGRRPALAVKHMFARHDLNGRVVIRAKGTSSVQPGKSSHEVTMHVQNADQQELFEDETPLILNINWANEEKDFEAPLTADGLLPDPNLLRRRNEPSESALFIRSGGMTILDVVRHFDDLVLTEKEEHVTEALRVIEPKLERIASVSYDRGHFFRDAPGGVLLKLRDIDDRIPIGSAGDGMWRMLGLALGLANAKDGVLLVDEIDTGFHYSIMEDMWRMVSERAAALSVQVFATTHSHDCYQSLTAIAKPKLMPSGEVTIQRIDPTRGEAVRFGNDEIMAAAERGLEVR